MTSTSPRGFGSLSPAMLARMQSVEPAPLLLDVRRRQAFLDLDRGLPGALPLLLDDDPILLPDVSRDRPVVLYCL